MTSDAIYYFLDQDSDSMGSLVRWEPSCIGSCKELIACKMFSPINRFLTGHTQVFYFYYMWLSHAQLF